ncbi:MAG: sodium:solute symporter family transporter [Planctomycetota bacterium]
MVLDKVSARTTTRDFFMAGRNLGIIVTGFAVFSTTMSGFGFVGGPGFVYSWGMSSLWMVVCSSLGFCMSFHLLSKRLRMFAEVRDTVSLPDAIAARYNSEWSRGLSAAAIILGVVGYLGTQILAMATVMRDLLANHPSLPHLSLFWCMFISSAVLVFHCVTGGIIAGVYTDMIQGAVMMVGAILIFFATLKAVPGGMAGAATTIMKDDPEAMGPWGTLGMMGCLSWFFLFALGAAAIHDVPKAVLGRAIRHELFWARTTTIVLGAISAFFALYVRDLVALLGAFGWGTFAAALVPTVAIGFNWKRATALAPNAAMASSLIINFALKLSGIPIPYGISGGAIALIVSLLLFFGLSFLSKPPRIETDIEAVMDP